MEKRLIDVEQAILILGVSKNTFYRYKRLYGIKTYMGEAQENLYDHDEILAFKKMPKENRKLIINH